MKRMHWLSAAAGAVALGVFSTAAGAAPLGNAAGSLNATAGENVLAQDVRWGRRCWRHRGHLHCRGVRRPYGYYGNPYYYGGYGYGPSIGLYFGHRHGHRHHRHHRGHRH